MTVVASPLSFAGAWQRVRKWGSGFPTWGRVVYWLFAWVLLGLWWAVILGYYALYLALPVLLLVLLPWRLMRRGDRRYGAN